MSHPSSVAVSAYRELGMKTRQRARPWPEVFKAAREDTIRQFSSPTTITTKGRHR